jgi:hypothetical protein
LDLITAAWRKSSRSGGNGGNCVEVATFAGSKEGSGRVIAVRDSKDRQGSVLLFTPDEWRTFAARVRGGEFDLG